jgi:hypothetical protein
MVVTPESERKSQPVIMREGKKKTFRPTSSSTAMRCLGVQVRLNSTEWLKYGLGLTLNSFS